MSWIPPRFVYIVHMNKTGSVPPLMAIHFLVFFQKKKNFQTMTVYCNTRHLCSTYIWWEWVGSRQKCKNLNSTIIFRPIYMQNVFGGTTVHEIYRFVIFFKSFASITWPYMLNSYKLTMSLSSSAVIITPYFYFIFLFCYPTIQYTNSLSG